MSEPEPPADRMIFWKADGRKVTASALGLGLLSATAKFDPGYGCVLEN